MRSPWSITRGSTKKRFVWRFPGENTAIDLEATMAGKKYRVILDSAREGSISKEQAAKAVKEVLSRPQEKSTAVAAPPVRVIKDRH